MTVSNSAVEEVGGGIVNDADGKLSMVRSTVSDNKSVTPGLGRGRRHLQCGYGFSDLTCTPTDLTGVAKLVLRW